MYTNLNELFVNLSKSKFRNRFHLNDDMKKYIESKGLDKIEEHARQLIKARIEPKYVPNDGKQTPMRGHPVFIAQHATACCCRGCLEKWHKIEKGRELSCAEVEYIVSVIMKWIKKEYEGKYNA